MPNSFINKILKSLKNPVRTIAFSRTFIWGLYYFLRYTLFSRNVNIRFPFYANVPVRIEGPGKVFIGKGCHVFKNVFKGLVIVTHNPDSSVKIGDKCLLGGVTIRCRHEIEIGDRVMTAVSLVQDSFFVNPDGVSSRIDKGQVHETKPIIIGSNVWLGAHSIVLGGCVIGDDAVLSAGAWCFGTDIGEYTLVSGNPAKKPLPIDKLLRLKGIVA